MPDRRAHRGPHPEDAALFSAECLPRLRAAADEFSWLLSRGYASASALKLVGDRHALQSRQRVAVARCCCPDEARLDRARRQIALAAVSGNDVWLDGYNVLTTIEAALAGGIVLSARDGAFRDMASMHGSYRKVAETVPAIEAIGRTLAAVQAGAVLWLLDRPVSNSGRLATMLRLLAQRHGWPWRVELANDPDRLLVNNAGGRERFLTATADSAVLDQCGAWLNLAREVVDREVRQVGLVVI